MSFLDISVAAGLHDRADALRHGRVSSPLLNVHFIPVESPIEMFRRMFREREFDVSEMSVTAFIANRCKGDFPFVGIPVFPVRAFRHGSIIVRTGGKVRAPSDLSGARIGVHGYAQTAAVWIRGILRDEYKIKFDQVTWFDAGGSSTSLPVPVTPMKGFSHLVSALKLGEIDALIAPSLPSAIFADGSISRLFPNYEEDERVYFSRTGIFPIMHTVIIQEKLHQEFSWVAETIFKLFGESKSIALKELKNLEISRCMLPWFGKQTSELDTLFYGDPYPYGLDANMSQLRTLIRYLREDGILDREPDPASLFLSMNASTST